MGTWRERGVGWGERTEKKGDKREGERKEERRNQKPSTQVARGRDRRSQWPVWETCHPGGRERYFIADSILNLQDTMTTFKKTHILSVLLLPLNSP